MTGDEFRAILKGAKMGDKDKQSLLAAMYFEGKGIPKSLCHAYIWANFAHLNGNKLASDLFLKMEKGFSESKNTLSELMRYREKAADMLEENPALLR